ncbi:MULTISPECIES: hypothetical protein [unclassified Streptomyces]
MPVGITCENAHHQGPGGAAVSAHNFAALDDFAAALSALGRRLCG